MNIEKQALRQRMLISDEEHVDYARNLYSQIIFMSNNEKQKRESARSIQGKKSGWLIPCKVPTTDRGYGLFQNVEIFVEDEPVFDFVVQKRQL